MKVAFDIDGTLQKHDNTLNKELLNVLLWFVSNGDEVYVHSGGGREYAERFVKKHSIEGVRAIAKGEIIPDLAFDDAEYSLCPAVLVTNQ